MNPTERGSGQDGPGSGFGRGGRNLSIMIPHFNCTTLLAETIMALKCQTLDLSEAQIEIVDNCSTDGDPGPVAEAAWPGRVNTYRQDRNIGMVENFNACVARANRTWVYILHSDDYTALDGIATLDALARTHPDAGVLLGRSIIVQETGVPAYLSPQAGAAIDGILEIDPAAWRINPAQFVSTIATKAAYDATGGFDPIHGYAADLLMWWQLASRQRAAYTNRIVGYYREHGRNMTSTMIRDGRWIAETAGALKLIGADLFGSVEAAAAAGHFRDLEDGAYGRAMLFLAMGDRGAYRANLEMPGQCGLDTRGRLGRQERRRRIRRLWARAWSLLRPAPSKTAAGAEGAWWGNG